MAQFANTVVIAVKPGAVRELLLEIAPVLTSNHLIVSIAAGITVTFIKEVRFGRCSES